MAVKEICVPPTMEAMEEVKSMLEEMMDEALVPMKIAIKMDIAVDEIFSNIVHYSGAKEAKVSCKAEDGRIELTFTDDGVPYNPLEAETPDVTLDADEREIGGLGIFLTGKLMDDMRYVYEEGKNKLYLMKIY